METEKRILEIKHAEKVTRLTNDMRQVTKELIKDLFNHKVKPGKF